MRIKLKTVLVTAALHFLCASGLAAAVSGDLRTNGGTAVQSGIHPAQARKRQFGGLFGGLDDPDTPPPHHGEQQTTSHESERLRGESRTQIETTSDGLVKTIDKLLTSVERAVSSTSTGGAATPAQTTPMQASAGFAPTAVPSPTATPTPTQSIGAANRAVSSPPTDWKVIGVAVIAVSVIGAGILGVVFFDHWWRFLRDLAACGGSRSRGGPGGEELVPDWEKQSWEYQLGGRVVDGMDGGGIRIGEDRVPSFGSPPAGWRMSEGAGHAGLGTEMGRNMELARAVSRRADGAPQRSAMEDPFRAQEETPIPSPAVLVMAPASPGPVPGLPRTLVRPSVPKRSRSSPLAREWRPDTDAAFSPSSTVTVNRSDTFKSAATEDAYGGLA